MKAEANNERGWHETQAVNGRINWNHDRRRLSCFSIDSVATTRGSVNARSVIGQVVKYKLEQLVHLLQTEALLVVLDEHLQLDGAGRPLVDQLQTLGLGQLELLLGVEPADN